MILCALLFCLFPSQESVIDMQTSLFSIVGGAFFGIFLCGFLSTRIHYQATVIAILLCFLLNLYLGANSLGWLPKAATIPVHSYWTGTIVNLAFCLFAWLISLLWPKPQKPLDGLTVWSSKDKR
jgi:Na+/proline symporter